MKIIEFLPNLAQPIKMFERISAKSVHLGDGSSKVQIYCIYFELKAGQGAFFEPGELHSKGSDIGMTVIMVQASKLEPKL